MDKIAGQPGPCQGSFGSLLDYSVTTARSREPFVSQDYIMLEAHRSYRKQELDDKAGKTSRRIRRFYQRYYTGVGVGGRLRFLSLTSSDEAVAAGLDIHRSWRCLLMRLRRRTGRLDYIGVREIKKDRQHLHLVFRGSYIEQELISALWREIHRSPVVDIRAMWKEKGGAQELAKYLGKEVLNRYWASYDWVFKGWVGLSHRVHLFYGKFPSRRILVTLARLKARARDDLLWALFPWAMSEEAYLKKRKGVPVVSGRIGLQRLRPLYDNLLAQACCPHGPAQALLLNPGPWSSKC